MDQGLPYHRGDRLDGRHAVFAAAVRLSLRRRERLDSVGDFQGDGAPVAPGDHHSGDDRDLGFRTVARLARTWFSLPLGCLGRGWGPAYTRSCGFPGGV